MSMRMVLLVWGILLSSGASASGTFEAGPVTIILNNGYDEDCIEDITQLCLASLRGDDLGSMELSAYERIRLLVVAVNTSPVDEYVSWRILPDDSIMVRPSGMTVEHPVYTILIENVGYRAVPTPFPTFAVDANEEGIFLTHPQPVWDDPTSTPGTNRFMAQYGDPGPEEGPNERDRVRPFEDFNSTSTDERIREPQKARPCEILEEQGCVFYADAVAGAWENETPNVRVGLSFVQAGVDLDPTAGDLDGLSRNPNAVADMPLGRGPTSAPMVAGALRPSPAAPFKPSDPGAPPARGPSSSGPSILTDPPKPVSDLSKAPTPPPSLPLATAAVAFTLAIIIAALYARIRSRDEALASTRRTAILAALEKDGPMTVSKLARAIGVDRTTVDHHAQVLSRTSLVRLAKQKNLLVVALPEQIGDVEVEAPVPLRERLIEHLAELGGLATRHDLDLQLPDVPRRSRNHALRQLQQAGRIELVHGVGAPRVRIITQNPSSA